MIRKGQELYYSPSKCTFSDDLGETLSMDAAKTLVDEHLEAGVELPMNMAMIRVIEANWDMKLVAEYYVEDIL